MLQGKEERRAKQVFEENADVGKAPLSHVRKEAGHRKCVYYVTCTRVSLVSMKHEHQAWVVFF